jgi:hypothetical protein
MPHRYLCAECGAVVIPDEAFTQMDERYALGKCPNGPHRGKTYLVREDVQATERKKKRRR